MKKNVFWYSLIFWYKGTMETLLETEEGFWYSLIFWYKGTDVWETTFWTEFWYSLIFWYKGTYDGSIVSYVDFGTLSSFGIKELY